MSFSDQRLQEAINVVAEQLVNHAIEAGQEYQDDRLEEAINHLDDIQHRVVGDISDRARDLLQDRSGEL